MQTTTWWGTLLGSLKEQTTAWLVGAIFALLSIFSSQITEHVRLALNRADLASKYYEELASDMSEYRFDAELIVEAIERGWTKAGLIQPLAKDYNESITKLRKKEWVYQSWMRRFWGEPQIKAFARCMDAVKAFDREAHNLNDEIATLVDQKKESLDKGKADLALERLKPALKALLESSDYLNVKLN